MLRDIISICLISLLMIPLVVADTHTLQSGDSIASPVCGTIVQTRSGSRCSQTTVSYRVSASFPVYVYWMNYTEYQTRGPGPLTNPKYDKIHSCGAAPTTLCPIADFVSDDPDKVLVVYNPMVNGPNNVDVTIKTNPSRGGGLAAGIIALIVVLAVCLPCMICGCLAYWCGWCCCRRAVHQNIFFNMSAGPVQPVSVAMVSRVKVRVRVGALRFNSPDLALHEYHTFFLGRMCLFII